MNILKLAAVVVGFVVVAAWLKTTWGVDLYGPLAFVASGGSDLLQRVKGWAATQ